MSYYGNSGYIIDIILGLAIILTGCYWLIHRKKGIKLLKQYSLGFISERICEKLVFIIGIFFIFVGVIALIFGLKGL